MNEPLPLLDFYIDDSGTRNPDHAEPTSAAGDWFGLGGVIQKAEDDELGRRLHSEFIEKWGIDGPLHSVKIRHRSGNFSWLASAKPNEVRQFFGDLDQLMTAYPAAGMACVIDRPGYHQRYHEQYGRQRWQLCKTAFSVLCERAAKFAQIEGRRVRLFVEETDRKSDQHIRNYFNELREEGMPFSRETSDKYGPLSAEELKYCLVDLKFKRKTSPPIQMADLYLYPICRAGYDELYRPLKLLRKNNKIIDQLLEEEARTHIGIKFSCFPKK